MTSPGTSAPTRCLVTLGCFVNSLYLLSKVLVRLMLAMFFLHGSLGPTPWLFSHEFSGPNPWLFTFFTAVWHVFHPTFSGHLLDVNLHMFHHRFWSSTTFIDFNVDVPFRITDAGQSIKSAQFITGFWNAHRPLVIRDVHSSVNVLNLQHPSGCSAMP